MIPEMQVVTYIMRVSCFHNTWGMITEYCQYELVNFADKLHIQYNILSSFQLLSVLDTTKIHTKTL